MLKYFNIAKSTYYYEICSYNKEDKNLILKDKIKGIFDENKNRYGYRRITLELRNQGIIVNHKKVKRIMKSLGLFGITPKAKYHSYKGDMNGTVANLLLNKVTDEDKNKVKYVQNFDTLKPNEKWTTDVTEFRISSGKLYLSPILDMFDGSIISYNISRHPNFEQITDMLNKAFEDNPVIDGLIFHSDQGWQYQMEAYHKLLKEKGIIQSMSRKGNCMDNSIMECFFGKLKNEMFYGHEDDFDSLNELKKSIEEYIYYYNNKRIKLKNKGLPPILYRQQSLNILSL